MLLQVQPEAENCVINRSSVFANGYCYGGLVVLDLARRNPLLVAVASFHGLLEPLVDSQQTVIAAAQVSMYVKVLG